MRQYYVYIVASKSRCLYIGITSDLYRRVAQHKAGEIPGFTATYHNNRLVYYEVSGDVYAAIGREKQLKGWRRAKKLALIESLNPRWRDLSEDWG